MKQRKVWRYSCEFCKKSNCSSYHMRRHESGCTANPNRVCGMCGFPSDIPELVAAARKCTAEDIKPLRDAAENCPACILAGIRQSGLQKQVDDYRVNFSFAFDFKKEKDEWWAAKNEERESAQGAYY